MTRWDAETRRGSIVPSVLVIGCTRGFIARCQRATPEGILVGGASLADYTKQAARLRPYVIVVTEDVRAFDGDRLDELRLAVGAKLVCFAGEEVADPELRRILGAAIEEVARRRGDSAAPEG